MPALSVDLSTLNKGSASSRSNDATGGIGGLPACFYTNGTTGGAESTADDEEDIHFNDPNGNLGQT